MKSLLLAPGLAMSVSALSAQEASDSVRLEFSHCENLYAERLAEFQGINSLSFSLINEGGQKEYDLYAVKVSPDTVIEAKVSFLPIVLKSDPVKVNMFAQAIDSVTAKVSIVPFVPRIEVGQPTFQCLLIEALPKRAFARGEEIPLAAYSTGRHYKFEMGGEVYDAYQICDVRNSGKNVADWGKEFNLTPYTYFVLRPKED